MHAAITELLSISSQQIGAPPESCVFLDAWGPLGQELGEMLAGKNGFYAYESALLVRPLNDTHAPLGLSEWNVPGLWKGSYAERLLDTLFFAEDVFGNQFCVRAGEVCAFNPETGLFETTWTSLGAWAADVLGRPNLRTGYPLARAWQLEHGALVPGVRLLPKVPFVCGGKYEVANLYALEDVEGMRFRASVANQIRDLPDGAQIIFKTSPIEAPGRRKNPSGT